MKHDLLPLVASEEMDSGAAKEIIEAAVKQASLIVRHDGMGFAKVLCVGCGDGTELDLWAERKTMPVGIDLNDASIEKTRKRGYQVEKMDMHNMTFEDLSFDVVFARDVFEHALSPMEALLEMARVSRQYVIVVVPDETWQSSAWHFIVPTMRQMLSLGEKAGLKLRAVREYNRIVGGTVINQSMYVFTKL